MEDVQYMQPLILQSMPDSDTVKLANAAKLLMEYEKRPAKADEFLDSQYSLSYKYGEERRICQFIFLTVLRNKLLIDTILAVFLKKTPRPKLFAVLKCACAEIVSAHENKIAQTVHSWVEVSKKICSAGESKLANAVLRKFSQEYSQMNSNAKTLEDFALLYSHPLWLAKSWQAQFGFEKAVRIMRKNQEPSEVFLRVQNTPKAKEEFQKYSEFLCESGFENFYAVKRGNFQNIKSFLDTRFAYIQDPATKFAPTLLNPQKSENILDLCAAPGGKSRMISDLVRQKNPDGFLSDTLLASVDLNSPRLEKLKQNLSKIDFLKTACIDCDIASENLQDKLEKSSLPTSFDAILLDAPCSNTGVLRRRPDARYRIEPKDISNCKALQIKILKNALPLLKKGGRFVYSTCSIDKSENEEAPQEAVKSLGGFKIEHMQTILPDVCDGAGIALIKRA